MGKSRAVKVGDTIIHRGGELVVTEIIRNGVKATRGAEALAEAKAELAEIRRHMADDAADITPRQADELRDRIAAMKAPEVTRFGCRKNLLVFDDERSAWVVPGQE